MKPRSEWKQPKRSPLPPRTTWLKSSGIPIDRRRTASEKKAKLEREYGGPDRRAFVSSLPCIACGAGPCVNAHVGKGGGMSYKAGYEAVVPLCLICHDESHRGLKTFAIKYALDLFEECRAVQRSWLEHLSRVA